MLRATLLCKLKRYEETVELLANPAVGDWKGETTVRLELAMAKFGLGKNELAEELLGPLLMECSQQRSRLMHPGRHNGQLKTHELLTQNSRTLNSKKLIQFLIRLPGLPSKPFSPGLKPPPAVSPPEALWKLPRLNRQPVSDRQKACLNKPQRKHSLTERQ